MKGLIITGDPAAPLGTRCNFPGCTREVGHGGDEHWRSIEDVQRDADLAEAALQLAEARGNVGFHRAELAAAEKERDALEARIAELRATGGHE